MRFRLLLGLLLAAVTVAVGVYGLAALWDAGDRVPEVPRGDQEVAWIHAATSGSAWERFVVGVHRARHDWPPHWPRLRVDDRRAFLDQTTAVPEVVLSLDGTDAKLHIRWYKLTSEADSTRWVQRLAQRDPPPLAFIGGGTSDRAVELAGALADNEVRWRGPVPLLLITTATANSILLDPPEDGPALPQQKPLMHIYPDRSFRFCFTNRQMAQAVVDFLGTQPDLRPSGDPWPALAAVGQAAAGPWGAWPLLAVQSAEYPPGANALVWDDDPYSIDLAAQFHQAFHRPEGPRVLMRERRSIPYSVGDFDRPNAWESLAADYLLRDLRANPLERQVLVLPAAAPARRVLRALSGALPLVGRYLVAVSGDSISVNTVYRDAELAWNIRALPVPLVFFTHQNPVAWDDDLKPPTATDDVLLHGELVRMLVEAAYRFPGEVGPVPPGVEALPVLLDSADELARRLRGRRPAFFDPDGDRLGGRGEYVLALRPKILDAGGSAQVAPEATLEVWTREGPAVPGRPAAEWKLVKRLVIDHGRSLPTALP